jgi:hypothetical protein
MICGLLGPLGINSFVLKIGKGRVNKTERSLPGRDLGLFFVLEKEAMVLCLHEKPMPLAIT